MTFGATQGTRCLLRHLLAVALAWLHGRIPHRGLRLWMAGLTVLVFARLALSPAVLAYHAKSAVPVFNWYLYTYLGAAAAFFASARLLRDQPYARRQGDA